MAMIKDGKATSARAFVRSFNVLLKFARLYGMDHARCVTQLEIAGKELQSALPAGSESGLLLSASGSQLLLDGVPLEATPAERSFAQMLSSAEISSLHFLPRVTRDDLARLASAFPSGAGKKALGDALKKVFEGNTGIRVNTISYVPTDSATANLAAAASITARALGVEGEHMQSLLDDPGKLIQLITAAEGVRSGADAGTGGEGGGPGAMGGGFHAGSGGGRGGPGSGGSAGHEGLGVGAGIHTPVGTGGAGAGSGGRPAKSLSLLELIQSALGPEVGSQTDTTQGNARVAGSGHAGGPSGGVGGTAQGAGGGQPGGAPASRSSGAESGAGYRSDSAPIRAGEGAGSGGGIGGAGGVSGGGTGIWMGVEGAGPDTGGGSSSAASGDAPRRSSAGTGGGARTADSAGSESAGAGAAAAGGYESGQERGGGGGAGPSQGSGQGPGRGSAGGASPSSVFDLIDMGSSGSGVAAGGGAGAEAPGRWEVASAELYTGVGSRPRRRTDFDEVERWGVGLGQLAEGEEDVQGLLGLLRQFAQFAKQPEDVAEYPAFQQRLSTVPLRVQRTLREALTTLASQMTPEKPGEEMMVQLAEHMAIRYALKSFQSGASRVSAVRELLDRMGREIDQLRKTVAGHEVQMAQEGVAFRPYAEQLNEQFWASVPQETKREVLHSKEAWCMSPQAVRQAVETRRAEGDAEGAAGILGYYAQNIQSDELSARRYTAMGITELGDLFAHSEDLLLDTIRSAGGQVAREKDAEARSLVSAAFVRLSTEAVTRRSYPPMSAAAQVLKTLASQDAATAENLSQRIGVHERIPELVEEALSAKECPAGLADLITLLPRPAAGCLAERFSQSGFREDCNLILGMARKTGAEGLSSLRETFRDSKEAGSVETVGLLSRLDPEALARYLPGRVREWPRSMHDRLVRYLAASGAHERARLILSVLDDLDPLVRPMALDEVGLVGDDLCLPRLLELAAGGIPAGSGPYLQVKSIEALGRARTPEAVALLRPLVEAKKMFHWVHPHEMRLAAAQALERIDPQWARDFLPRAGFSPEELAIGPVDPDPNSACNRQRRYVRMRLHRVVPGVTVKESARLEVAILSLSGGAGVCDHRFAIGTLISLRLGGRMRPATAQAFVRTFRNGVLGFEFAELDLEERFRLRRLIVETGGLPLSDTPLNRTRVIRPRIKR